MKRISPATVTFGVMAMVLGLVAAYIVRQALEKPAVAQRPAPPPETVPVVFALNVIPKNTRLTARDVFVQQVPKNAKLPPGVFRGVNLVEGRITKETIAAGRAIRENMLLGLDESLPDLAERLPPGHRAVTIAVQGADTGGKRLSEGDRIDIAMTVEGTHPDLGEVTTRTLMRNVLVVDAAAYQPHSRGANTTQRVQDALNSLITVAVPPADANKLIVAQRTGTLHATLVSAADAQAEAAPSTDWAVNRRQLLGLKEVVPPRKFTIEKWTGSQVRLIEMSDERIRESREVSSGRREVSSTPADRPSQPAQQPTTASPAAPAPQDLGRDAPSGVREPNVLVQMGDPPLPSALTAANPTP